MALVIICGCGAEYKQEQRWMPCRAPGSYACQFCGDRLAEWCSTYWLHHTMMRGPLDPEAAKARKLIAEGIGGMK